MNITVIFDNIVIILIMIVYSIINNVKLSNTIILQSGIYKYKNKT